MGAMAATPICQRRLGCTDFCRAWRSVAKQFNTITSRVPACPPFLYTQGPCKTVREKLSDLVRPDSFPCFCLSSYSRLFGDFVAWFLVAKSHNCYFEQVHMSGWLVSPVAHCSFTFA